MLTQDVFLATVENFLERSGMKPTAFGKGSVGDPNLVRDLRAGRSLSLKTAERVAGFIEAQESRAKDAAQ